MKLKQVHVTSQKVMIWYVFILPQSCIIFNVAVNFCFSIVFRHGMYANEF